MNGPSLQMMNRCGIGCLIVLLVSPWCRASFPVADNPLSGPLRIAKLLWNANAENAAQTLRKSVATALQRDQLDELREALVPLKSQIETVVAGSKTQDPRYEPALAAQLLMLSDDQADAPVLERAQSLFEQPTSPERAPGLLLSAWFHCRPASAFASFERALQDNPQPALFTAWLLPALKHDSERATRLTLAAWKELQEPTQFAAIEPLTSAAQPMRLLLEAVANGQVNKDLINTNQLRKWTQSDNTELQQRIVALWGQIRTEDNQARQQLVRQTLRLLESGKSGSASRGRQVFTRVCSQCHLLHGQGFEVGPNISANGRGNLAQLVSNVLDPSLVIGEAFQAKTVLTVDGKIVSGLLAGEDERYVKLKVQGGKVAEFDKDEDVELIKDSDQSLMPEGVETQMSEQELLDLFAYLCLLKAPGAPDNALIPGTPADFVQP